MRAALLTVNKLNAIFAEIQQVFSLSGIQSFEKLPDDNTARGKFASLFKSFNSYLEAAKIQGITWNTPIYEFSHDSGMPETSIVMQFDENTCLVLAMRYKELFSYSGNTGTGGDVSFEIDGYLTEIDTARIDSDYMNSRFDNYMK